VLTFRDGAGRKIVAYSSDAKDAPPHRKPGTKRGLNRFIWDLKYPGPTKLDAALAPPRPKPLAPDPENPSGPTAVPGPYGVDLAVGDKTQSAAFEVTKDPRLGTPAAAYSAQFTLHKELIASLSKLNEAVNRLRTMKRQLGDLAARTGRTRSRAKALVEKLSAIESVLVDPKRMSARDVLRHPAGLNDTLLDLVAMATTADAAPTTQTRLVSQEIMGKVDEQIAKLDALVSRDIAPLNTVLAKARIGHIAV
jgi:hypothetical protein